MNKSPNKLDVLDLRNKVPTSVAATAGPIIEQLTADRELIVLTTDENAYKDIIRITLESDAITSTEKIKDDTADNQTFWRIHIRKNEKNQTTHSSQEAQGSIEARESVVFMIKTHEDTRLPVRRFGH